MLLVYVRWGILKSCVPLIFEDCVPISFLYCAIRDPFGSAGFPSKSISLLVVSASSKLEQVGEGDLNHAPYGDLLVHLGKAKQENLQRLFGTGLKVAWFSPLKIIWLVVLFLRWYSSHLWLMALRLGLLYPHAVAVFVFLVFALCVASSSSSVAHPFSGEFFCFVFFNIFHYLSKEKDWVGDQSQKRSMFG